MSLEEGLAAFDASGNEVDAVHTSQLLDPGQMRQPRKSEDAVGCDLGGAIRPGSIEALRAEDFGENVERGYWDLLVQLGS